MVKKKVEEIKYPGDLFLHGSKRQSGWMRKNMLNAAWLFKTKTTASDLREISDWAQKVADYIDQVSASKIK